MVLRYSVKNCSTVVVAVTIALAPTALAVLAVNFAVIIIVVSRQMNAVITILNVAKPQP